MLSLICQRQADYDAAFETCKLLTTRINPSIIDWSGFYFQGYTSSWLGKIFRFTVFRILESAFVKIPRPWLDLIIMPLVENGNLP